MFYTTKYHILYKIKYTIIYKMHYNVYYEIFKGFYNNKNLQSYDEKRPSMMYIIQKREGKCERWNSETFNHLNVRLMRQSHQKIQRKKVSEIGAKSREDETLKFKRIKCFQEERHNCVKCYCCLFVCFCKLRSEVINGV